MSSPSASRKKQRIRLLKYCATEPFNIVGGENKSANKLNLKRPGASAIAIGKEVFDFLVTQGLIRQHGQGWVITDAGKMHLRRLLSKVDEFSNQHRMMAKTGISEDGNRSNYQSNTAESPLARLRMRICANGKPYICDANFQAGERLRSDFTKGQMMPRLSSNWEAPIGGGKRCGERNSIGDMSDSALAARLRTKKALLAAGPEFSGVLIDICCFLKGLERVEQERQWPPRSAKLMLDTALSILARHYGLTVTQTQQGSMRHCGGDDYRPELFVEG